MRNWHAFAIAGLTITMGAIVGAQQTGPSAINGCVYLASPPSLTDLQQYVYTCDSTGKLRMNGIGPPPVGCDGVLDLSEGCPLPMLGVF